jgi:hypothetical protein
MRVNDRNRAWMVVVLLFLFRVIKVADKANGALRRSGAWLIATTLF